MKTLVFDIESDDLLEGCTKMHVLYTKDSTTNEKKYWLENDLGWQAELNSADAIVGHNIVAFDLPALKKLFNWEPDKSVKVYDTLIKRNVTLAAAPSFGKPVIFYEPRSTGAENYRSLARELSGSGGAAAA